MFLFGYNFILTEKNVYWYDHSWKMMSNEDNVRCLVESEDNIIKARLTEAVSSTSIHFNTTPWPFPFPVRDGIIENSDRN